VVKDMENIHEQGVLKTESEAVSVE
jgi:hypothetical protein